MNPIELYHQVGLRHAQFQDGAITFSEFCNTIIVLGIQHQVITISEGEYKDVTPLESSEKWI